VKDVCDCGIVDQHVGFSVSHEDDAFGVFLLCKVEQKAANTTSDGGHGVNCG
jgi:hypothetical protein